MVKHGRRGLPQCQASVRADGGERSARTSEREWNGRPKGDALILVSYVGGTGSGGALVLALGLGGPHRPGHARTLDHESQRPTPRFVLTCVVSQAKSRNAPACGGGGGPTQPGQTAAGRGGVVKNRERRSVQ